MADKKISQLTSATTPLAGTEVLPIVQSSTTVKVAVSDLTAGRAVSATQFTPTGGSATGNTFYLPATNSLGLTTNGTERVRIDSTGNVGIGTTSPSNKLQVSGTALFGPTSTVGVAYNVSSSNGTATQAINTGAGINFTIPFTGYANGLTGAQLFSANEAASGFATYFAINMLNTGGGISERLRITSAGKLVVGGTTVGTAAITTNGSNEGFEVNSITRASYQWYVNNGPTDKKYWRASVEGTNGNWYLETLNDAYSTATTRMTLTNAGLLQLPNAPSSGVYSGSIFVASPTDNDVYRIQMGRSAYYLANVVVGRDSASANSYSAYMAFETTNASQSMLERLRIDSNGNVLAVSIGGLGYGTGSGGAVTQATSRTTGVTLNKSNGAITLVSAAGTTTWQSFTVTNSVVAATDTIIVNQKSGTDLYQIFVTNVAAGSFKITFATTGGTTTEQPVFNFAVIKAVTS